MSVWIKMSNEGTLPFPCHAALAQRTFFDIYFILTFSNGMRPADVYPLGINGNFHWLIPLMGQKNGVIMVDALAAKAVRFVAIRKNKLSFAIEMNEFLQTCTHW